MGSKQITQALAVSCIRRKSQTVASEVFSTAKMLPHLRGHAQAPTLDVIIPGSEPLTATGNGSILFIYFFAC